MKIGVKKRYELFPDAGGDDYLEVEDQRMGSQHIEIAIYAQNTLTVNDELPVVHLSTADVEGLVEVLQSILDSGRDQPSGGKQESSTRGKQPPSTAANSKARA